jgi:hypothetical protein
MIKALFTGDGARYDGIPPINIYLMRLIYGLMLVFLGKDSWTTLLTHQGDWAPFDALAWSVWAAFASFGLLGILHPVRMLPILLLEIFYKIIWLVVVAYPLWAHDRLAGSPAEGMTFAFAWVVLPIVAVPWPYVVRTFLLGRVSTAA